MSGNKLHLTAGIVNVDVDLLKLSQESRQHGLETAAQVADVGAYPGTNKVTKASFRRS